MRPLHSVCLGIALACQTAPLPAQRPTVDHSAAHTIYRILESMQKGAPRDSVSLMLDTVLAGRAYQTMFRHYNRSWRPNHLPPPVFKRMILSLRYPDEYSPGENQRADQMLPVWHRFYADLQIYRANLRQLEQTDLGALIDAAVRQARSWLPPEWTIPASYLPIMPSGGSPAFSIEPAQGYDFFQLPRDSSGTIVWNQVRSTVAHETHHLGVRSSVPPAAGPRDSVALEFLSIFMPEGTATKFITNFPGGCAPAVDPARMDPAFTSEASQWWARYTEEGAALFARVAATFERARSGALGGDSLRAEIGRYWLAGHISPVYFVGAEMYGAIYHAYGKDGAFAVMRDVSKLVPMYAAALKRRPGLLGKCPSLPDSTLKHAREIATGTVPRPR